MRLDRNIHSNEGRGKYAIVKLRAIAAMEPDGAPGSAPDIQINNWNAVVDAIATLKRHDVLDYGSHQSDAEFFLIRLKDKYARAALLAYALAAEADDRQYAAEVSELANRAGYLSPWCKRPD